MTSVLRYSLPKKHHEAPVHAIIVCIQYADYLAATLPTNRPYFKHVYIVTEQSDAETLELAAKYNCIPIFSESRQANGATFNKSGLLYEAQKIVHDLYPLDWICILDADILLCDQMATFTTRNLDPYALYGIHRNIFETVSDFEDGKKQDYTTSRGDYICGYFQLYWNKAKYYAPWSLNCSECDIHFMKMFPKRGMLPDVSCDHLGYIAKNWDGRCTERWIKPPQSQN